jgi:cysteine desulfurase
MQRIYLDHNASSPLRPEARLALIKALEAPTNPSSVHHEGRSAKGILEESRRIFASGLCTHPKNITFTSGATEAANFVLSPSLRLKGAATSVEILLIAAGEHHAVLKGHRFLTDNTVILPLTKDGLISLDQLKETLARLNGKRAMLALQVVNNETGVIQPINEASLIVKEHGGIVISDATQAIGRMPVSFDCLKTDILFFSSHKIGGPLGAGVLAYSSDSYDLQEKLLLGGGQEFGRRAGTENIPAIAGFAAAYTVAQSQIDREVKRLGRLRQELETKLVKTIPEIIIFSQLAPRAANTVAFAIPDVSAQTLLMALDLAGVSLSTGSACSSGKVNSSHVLEAMGTTEKMALRVSMGWSTCDQDIEVFGTILENVVRTIRLRRTGA